MQEHIHHQKPKGFPSKGEGDNIKLGPSRRSKRAWGRWATRIQTGPHGERRVFLTLGGAGNLQAARSARIRRRMWW
ncbi:hypothetical protein ZOSMA_69G00350 [Zostera marina]|uniref:Uncharacterized protein n=1 Tax=Zostera marina TaxID=29655 RepID=A0A0K9NRW4_ZOSMR|nr:hypothetical protein ZOSMA_69G00350 [Zostera marina]